VSQVQNVLRISADVRRLSEVREFIRQQAADMGADAETTDDMVLAVDELTTNSILHGYRGEEGVVEVEVGHEGSSMVVRVRDQAPPFNPTRMPDPDTTLPLELRPKGGLGIYLSREVSDGLVYRRTGDGNETTIVKRLTRGQGGGTC
jgi:serine/threonine-protein kinase RsbW